MRVALPYPTQHPHRTGLLSFTLVEQRIRSTGAFLLACSLAVTLALHGCTSKRQPAGIRFPITHGFHTHVPSEQQRILILGDPLLTKVTEEWLRSHHYSHVLVSPQTAHHGLDRETVLTLATQLQAEFVLLLEREELRIGALIESDCGARFNISITVRGLSLMSREPVFRGTAYYPHCVEHHRETVQNLTCQALATAWGFRPSGQLEIPSSLACTTGQTSPSTTHQTQN